MFLVIASKRHKMKKILIAFSALPLICASAFGQESYDCEQVQSGQAICTTSNSPSRYDDFIVEDAITFNTEPNWERARKICMDHIEVYKADGSGITDLAASKYSTGLQSICALVAQHYEEEDRHTEANKRIDSELKNLHDLNELSVALGVLK